MTSYVLVSVPMYWRNMLPPSLGSKWVGREFSKMEACSTDNFYHSNHFNPEKMVACFSEIFVNITRRLQPEYSLLWKQMLCVGHIDNSCYKSLTQRHWERLPTFSVIHFILFSPLCKRNSVTWVAIWECSTLYYKERERESGGGGDFTNTEILHRFQCSA
jgi:hypothetical protein